MDVVYPAYWFWWLAVPVSLGIIYLVYRRVAYITENWFAPETYARSYPFFKFWLRAGAFVLLFVALLGPYWGERPSQTPVLGREIYILLDVSASMNAEDVRPNRLAKVKEELRSLIDAMKGDKIGLIVFAENAYVQCPLTTDYQAVKLFLDLASSNQFAQTGTNFRAALGVALNRFSNLENPNDKLSRVIILVSDGEDFGGKYTSIIDRFRQFYVRVFTVGVGTLEGAPIPHSEKGIQLGYKSHEDGTRAISYLQEESMQQIAAASGTNYIRIDDKTQSLEALQDQLQKLSVSPLSSRIEQVKNNKYQIFLGISLVLLLISLFIMPIRKDETKA